MTKTFRVRPVLASIWLVIKSHYLILGMLAIVLHFFAWRLVGELQRSLVDYGAQRFRLDLPALVDGFIATWSAAELLQDAAVQMYYFVLMQVAVTTLMYEGLQAAEALEQGHPRARQALVLARFKRAEFLFDVLRSLGILAAIVGAILVAFVAIALSILVFQHESLHFLHSVGWIETLFLLSLTVAFVMFVVMVGTRWAVGVPMTIVENTTVLESLRRSWRLTAGCWVKLFAMSLLLPVPFEVLPALLPAGEAASPATALGDWGSTIVATTLSATVYSVCYSHLRNAPDGDETAPSKAPVA